MQMVSYKRSTTFSRVAKISLRNPRFRISFQIYSMGFLSGVYGGRVKAQYSRVLPVFPIYAIQIHRSTIEWYPVDIAWIIPSETDSYGQYCYRAWQESRTHPSAVRPHHRHTGIPEYGGTEHWTGRLPTPAVFGPVDAAKACFILEHKARLPDTHLNPKQQRKRKGQTNECAKVH